MFKRIIEDHQGECFSGIENAMEYAERVENASKMRFRGFLKKLNALDIKGNYLEIGAGSGVLAVEIAEKYQNISIKGVDVSPDLVSIANKYIEKKNLESRIKFISGNIENDKLLEELGKYDLVYSTFSLHHFENPEKAIKNLLKLVKDNGVLLIYDLKRVWWLYWVPKQNGFFKSIRASYMPNEIKNILNNIGIKNYEVKGIFPFFLQNITIWK